MEISWDQTNNAESPWQATTSQQKNNEPALGA
jgi:hypothetical protein